MASVNKAIVVGNLGKDPELRNTQDGTAVCNFSVATTDSWKDKGGEKQEKTEWHRIVAWGRLAEVCAQYLHKGKQVYIEGKLQTREWEQDGQKRYTTEIVAREMQMLGTKADNMGGQHQQAPAQPAANNTAGFPPAPQPGGADDDLPF